MVTTVEQLAALIRGTVVGDGRVPILAAKPVQDAGPGDITFLDDERYLKQVKASPASALIVGPHFRSRMTQAGEAADRPVIEVPEPLAAFLVVRDHLSGATTTRWVGIHPQAWVAPSARIAEDVAIYPFSYVGEDAVVGPGCTIHPHAVVGRSCVLGSRVTLHPHVTLYEGVHLGDRVEVHSGTVLGADGFGYRPVDGKHEKVPQRGGVEIGDDVEIGANCTIDRGTFGPTVVGEGTKIDNLVMIGHNNRIGRHNLLCGQVGLAGSCRTGDSVVMGGQVGVKDHTEIGDRVMIGAQAGVHRNIPEGQQVLGSPAMPIKEQRQLFALVARLPMMTRQLRGLVEDVTRLKGLIPAADGPGPDGEER